MKLKNNLNVDIIFNSLTSRYAWYHYYEDERDLIKRAIEEGLETKYLVDPRFNMGQMLQIYTGLKKGIDVSKYAKTRMSINQIITLRTAIEEGIDVSEFSKISISRDKMEALIRRVKLGLPISAYCDKSYDAECINEMTNFELHTIRSKKKAR